MGSVLVPIPAEHVATVWPMVAPLLAPAVRRADGTITLDDVRELLLARDMQLWTSWRGGTVEAAAVTEIRTYLRRRVCAIPFVGGVNRRHWLGFEPVVADWARAHGCDALEGYARPGWLRVLRHWRSCWTVIRRDV